MSAWYSLGTVTHQNCGHEFRIAWSSDVTFPEAMTRTRPKRLRTFWKVMWVDEHRTATKILGLGRACQAVAPGKGPVTAPTASPAISRVRQPIRGEKQQPQLRPATRSRLASYLRSATAIVKARRICNRARKPPVKLRRAGLATEVPGRFLG